MSVVVHKYSAATLPLQLMISTWQVRHEITTSRDPISWKGRLPTDRPDTRSPLVWHYPGRESAVDASLVSVFKGSFS